MALTRIQDIVIDSVSRPVPGASVAVLTQPVTTTATQPGSPLASIFLDAAGVNAAPNPLLTDGLGNYDFYVAPGVYTLQIYGNKIFGGTTPQQIVIPDVQATLLVNPSSGTTGQFVTGIDSNGNLIYSTPTNSTVAVPINAQSGTTYTVLNSDQGKLITFNNAGSVSVTLPQAGVGSAFLSGWFAYIENIGAGTVTITPTSSTIDGAGTIVLSQNAGVIIASNGANYFTMRGTGGASGTSQTANLFILSVANPDVGISRTAANTMGVGNGTAGSTAGTEQATQFVQTPDAGTTSASRLDSLGVGVGDGAVVRFSSTAISNGTADTGLSRWNAGTLAAGNGSQGDFSGRLFTSVANTNITPVTVTATTAQTSLQTVTTLSAELNAVGRWVTIRARGFESTGATGGTVTFKLAIGATTLITFGAFSPANSLTNSAWYLEVDVMVVAAGASGSLEVQGHGLWQNVTGNAQFNTATISGINLTGTVAFTVNSTASQTTTSITSRMMGYQRNN